MGHIGYEVHAPGVEHISSRLPLSRISGGLKVYSISLQEKGVIGGNLSFQFLGLSSKSTAPPRGRHNAIAHLFLSDESGWEYEFEIMDFDQDFLLEGLPQGTYSYKLFLSNRFPWSEDAQYLSNTIALGSLAHKEEILVDRLGSISVALYTKNAQPYLGTAEFNLYAKEDDRSYPYSFTKWPYILEGIPEGDYWLRLDSPKSKIGKPFISETIRVFRNEQTTLDMTGGT